MQWTKPDFEEIALSMEVTAYSNTDDETTPPMEGPVLARSSRGMPAPQEHSRE